VDFQDKTWLQGHPNPLQSQTCSQGLYSKIRIGFGPRHYSPVVKPTSLRTVLALVAARNLELIQLDIKTAFLYGELEEELFCENPGNGHWNGVKRILAYLAGTSHFGLLFDGNKEEKLIGYSDSDYAGNVDNRRSVSGLLFTLCGWTWTLLFLDKQATTLCVPIYNGS
jgi:hypothetical protein